MLMNNLLRLQPIIILLILCFVVTHTLASAQTPPLPILWRADISGDPRGLAVDEQTGRVYVAEWTAEKVAAVDPSGTIATIIDAPATEYRQWGPEALAFDPQTKRVFAVETNGDITVIDTSTNTIINKLTFGEGGGWPMSAHVVVDSAGRRVVSTIRFASKKIVALNADSMDVAARIGRIQSDAVGLAVNEKTHMAYVGSPPTAVITGIDLITNTEFPVVSGLAHGPSNLVADPRTNLLYGVAGPAGLLYMVDTGNNKLGDTIDVPQQAQSSDFLALNADSDRLYYTSASGLVSINTKTKELVAIRAFAGTATGLAYDSTRQRLYILDGSGLTAVDASQIDTPPPPLPGTGGPPASSGASRWIFLRGFLAAIGCLMLWRSFRGIRS